MRTRRARWTTKSWPLPAGQYVVRLMPDDGYVSVAESARFTIT
jgi:hypothetical protein